MQNTQHMANGKNHACMPEIITIWDVHEQASYNVPRGHDTYAHPGLILCRTLRGEGEAWTTNGRHFILPPNSLILLENPAIRRYKTHVDTWEFWWFQIIMHGPLPLPLNHMITVPVHPKDEDDFQTITQLVKSPAATERCLAASMLGVMLQRWISQCPDVRPLTPQRAAVENLIRMMHDTQGEPWTVEDMAKTIHLSVRRFRQIFHDATGTSPKIYYDNLRLTHAREQLIMGMGNVSQVAEAFGYSSPFHFSKAFRKHFGHPPSDLFS